MRKMWLPKSERGIYRLLTPIIVTFSCLVITCASLDADAEITEGQPCDPDEFKAIPDSEDRTRFWFCDSETRTIVSEACPIEHGQQKIFDSTRLVCRFQRVRRTPAVPRSSHLSEPCIYNTDCLQNLYCLAGSCVCIPGFVDIGEECVPAINPGQTGCIYDRQCAGAWPSTTCKLGVCQCPSDQFPADTRDGVVCVKAGKCPFPDGYAGASPLDQLSTDATCRYGDMSAADDKSACFANGQYAGDIYDCIPKSADKVAAEDGLCCPSRALTCIQPKAAALEGIETRYWYNSITGQCESFMWSSASNTGNSNNFRTPDHCMAFCGGMCTRGSPQLSKGKSLRCLAADSQCDSGHYTCSAHSGKLRYCCPLKDFICSQTGGRLYGGTQPTGPDVGIAPAPSPTGGGAVGGSAGMRWFYDRKAGRCLAFEYKGLAGNFNNFLNENDCQMFCGKAKCEQGEPLKDHYGNDQDCNGMLPCPNAYECRKNVCCPKTQTVCIQPKFISSASCGAASRQRHWFNARTRDCEEFNDGGCRGNDNNFDSYASCMAFCSNTKTVVKCIQGEPDKDSSGEYRKCSNAMDNCRASFECYYDGFAHGCCPTKEFICRLSAESGKACSTSTVRWFFDYTLRLCRPFEYLGCDGNGNNFVNRRECERFCGSGVQLGCPYGGGAGEDADSWKSRVCDPKVPKTCSNGLECMKIFVNGQFSNYCCPTRAHICRLEQKVGDTCATSPATRRYLFNAQSRECEEFSYRGCHGNENNFVTLSQCSSFCHAAACRPGEIVYMDSSTREPLTCRVSAADTTCPAGYSCVLSELLNRAVCCGSTDLGVCPAGEKAYIDAISQDPKECRSASAKDECPPGFACRANGQDKSYCCGPAVTAYCPPGRMLYRDSTTQQPQACEVASDSTKGACPLGYSCYSPKPERMRGFCCAIDADLKKDNSMSTKACPRGYVGYKQPGTSAVQTCSGRSSRAAGSTCPLGYACLESPTDGRNRCCGISGGCAYPTVAYINSRTGQPMRCRQGGLCPQGYFCKPTSSRAYVCCSASTSMEDEEESETETEEKEEAEFEEVPVPMAAKGTTRPTTVAPRKPKCANEVEDGDETGQQETPPLCDADRSDSCPAGYECVLAANLEVHVCCKVAKSVCGDQSIPYVNPGSKKPQSCVSGGTNKCPSGYRCTFSNHYEKFYCCSAGDVCPAGYRAHVVDSTPQRCAVARGTKNPCPKTSSCMYSRLLRDYVCCSQSNRGGQTSSADPRIDSILEKRAMCVLPCSSTGMHARRLCPHGFRCESIGNGLNRCCPLDGSTDDMENEKEPHEIEPETIDICNRMGTVRERDPNSDPESDPDLDLDSDSYSHSLSFRPSVWHCHPSDHSSCTGARECRYIGRKQGYRCCPLSTTSSGEWSVATPRPPPHPRPAGPVASVITFTRLPPTANTEPCRVGQPYQHPVTKTPLVCGSATGFCPKGYFCEYSGVIHRYICCPRVTPPAKGPRSSEARAPVLAASSELEQGGVFFLPGGGYGGSFSSSMAQFHSPQVASLSQNPFVNANGLVTTLGPFMRTPATMAPRSQPMSPQRPSVVMEKSETMAAPSVDLILAPALPAPSPVVPPPAVASPGTVQSSESTICDLRQKKRVGQECCHDSQCGASYPCRRFAGRRICRCPRHLVLDLTVYPFRCASSCLYWLHDGVCTLRQQE